MMALQELSDGDLCRHGRSQVLENVLGEHSLGSYRCCVVIEGCDCRNHGSYYLLVVLVAKDSSNAIPHDTVYMDEEKVDDRHSLVSYALEMTEKVIILVQSPRKTFS